jgi:hypothetical protein
VHGEIAFARRSSDEQAAAVVVPNYEGHSMVTYDCRIRKARPIVDEFLERSRVLRLWLEQRWY